MPLRLKDSKVHKVMIINCLEFLILFGFVPLWQNYSFMYELHSQKKVKSVRI